MPAQSDIRIETDCSLPVDAVVGLYRDGGWLKDTDDPAAIPLLLKGSFMVASAWAGDELVGMGRVLSDGFSDAYIQDVVVLRNFRGKGIGGRLVAHLRDRCIDLGILWVGLIAEPGTTSFYERLGFNAMPGNVPMVLRPVRHAGESL